MESWSFLRHSGRQDDLRGAAGVVRAFVLGLDGTLSETEELKALSYARVAAELRPDLSEG